MLTDQFSGSEIPLVLTIAGSDSGGGAGIQADLKTFAALGVFGSSAVTCVTAQTPVEVRAIEPLPASVVTEQIRAVSDGFPIAAAKTGMLYTAPIIQAVAKADITQGIPILVVDPVMVADSGARLLKADAIEALCNDLLPLARVVTPNLHEAEIIWGKPITTVSDQMDAARDIGTKYDVACVVKGGHLDGPDVVDVLFDEGESELFRVTRIHAMETHGCGCAFSAALVAHLAHGELMRDAVQKAQFFVLHALRTSKKMGHHHPLNFQIKNTDLISPA